MKKTTNDIIKSAQEATTNNRFVFKINTHSEEINQELSLALKTAGFNNENKWYSKKETVQLEYYIYGERGILSYEFLEQHYKNRAVVAIFDIYDPTGKNIIYTRTMKIKIKEIQFPIWFDYDATNFLSFFVFADVLN